MTEHNNTPEEMETFFDQRADSYDEHVKKYEKTEYFRDIFVKQLPGTSEYTQILDLGCGTGREIKYILNRQPNAFITCVDLSEQMLDRLRAEYNDRLSNLSIIKASYFDFNFRKNKYDHAVACVTMHHWLFKPKVELYTKICDSLKAGGTYILNDYYVPWKDEKEMMTKYLDMVESGEISDGKFYHIDIPFSVKTEIKVLKEAGFSIVNVIEEYYSETFNAAVITAEK